MIERYALTNLLFVVLFVGFQIVQSADATNTDKLKRHSNRIPGEYIVVWKEMPHGPALNRYPTHGASGLNMSSINLSGDDTDGQLAKLLDDPQVEYVEENIPIYASRCTTHNLYPGTWGLDRLDQASLPLDKKYSVNETNASGDDTMVYVLDTGIDVNHYEFGGRASWGTNTIDDIDRDCDGHGTTCAGLAGGLNVGVAKNVKLMAIKVLNCGGLGTIKTIIGGIDFMLKHHAKRGGFGVAKSVASASLGTYHSDALNDAVNKASKQGVIFVVAAGNDKRDARFYSPASARESITVGATDPDDVIAAFSNFGPAVDIFAPGVRIKSATIHKATHFNGGRTKRSYDTEIHPGGYVVHRVTRPTRSTQGRIRNFCSRLTCPVPSPPGNTHPPRTTPRTTTTRRATTPWAYPTPGTPPRNPAPDTRDPTFSDTDAYHTSSGTSLACPHVAGVVALLLQELPPGVPLPTGAQMRAVLRSRSVPVVRNVPADTTNALLQHPKCA